MWIGTAGGLFVLERLSASRAFAALSQIPRPVHSRSGKCERSPKALTARSGSARSPVFFGGFPTAGSSANTPFPLPERSATCLSIGGPDMDRPRPRAEPGGSHGASSITEYVAADSRGHSRSVAPISREVQPPHGAWRGLPIRDDRGIAGHVRSLSEGSDGRVWIGTPGGLIEFDGKRFRVYSERHGLANETINASPRTARATSGSAPTPAASPSSRGTASSASEKRTGSGTIT